MALPDIKKYDLLNLILAETWPETKQADTVLKFNEALAGYLNENLSQYLDEAAESEFETLMKDPSITPEKLEEFYKQKIPDFWQKIEDLTLAFKKLFVASVYEEKVKELQTSVSGIEPTMTGETDEAKKAVYQKVKDDLNDWQGVLAASQADDWDKVSNLLQVIPH